MATPTDIGLAETYAELLRSEGGYRNVSCREGDDGVTVSFETWAGSGHVYVHDGEPADVVDPGGNISDILHVICPVESGLPLAEDFAGRTVFEIPDENLEALHAKIAKLNKRAVKLGAKPIVLVEVDTKEFKIYRTKDGHQVDATHCDATWNGEVKIVHSIQVIGEAPKFAGWAFIGTLDHQRADDGTVVNFLRAVPGFELPEYRNAQPDCDHCKAKRHRLETFVCQHDDGHRVQVGRQCVADFLGHQNPENVARFLEIILGAADIAREFESYGGGGRRERRWSLDYFLRFTTGAIAIDGWTSVKKTRELNAKADEIEARTGEHQRHYSATVSNVLCAIEPHPRDKDGQRAHDAYLAATDDAKAEGALAWAQSLIEQDNLNDYFFNIAQVCRIGYVTHKNAGLACSIIATYERELERAAGIEREKKAALTREWVGTLKKRAVFVLTLLRHHSYETGFGTKHIYGFADEAGNRLTWFSTRYISELVIGGVYKVKATPVEHKEDAKWGKETHINRAVIEETISVPEAVPAPGTEEVA